MTGYWIPPYVIAIILALLSIYSGQLAHARDVYLAVALLLLGLGPRKDVK